LLIFLIPGSARADCADPAGNGGKVIYSAPGRAVQYCNGFEWVTLKRHASCGSTNGWNAYTVADNTWRAVTYGEGKFVAVASGSANRVMTSPDGISWTSHAAAEDNSWYSVAYGNGTFVAVAQDGTHRVMTSPDGVTWAAQTAAEANQWRAVTFGNGLFVAVSVDGANRIMTSPDGVTWTPVAAPENNAWRAITYGGGQFVAVSTNGTNQVMTSADGVTWNAYAAAAANSWFSVTYGNGKYVAVSYDGTQQVMTSPDGQNWTMQTQAETTTWRAITYGNGLFVALADSGTNLIMTSPDGVNWSGKAAPDSSTWIGVTFGAGTFVGVANTGTNRIMTTGCTGIYPYIKNMASAGADSTVTSLNVPYPAGIAAGDLLVAISSGDIWGWSPPAGWYQLSESYNLASSTTAEVFYKTATGSEAGNVTFTSDNGSIRGEIAIIDFGNVDTYFPVTVDFNKYSNADSGTVMNYDTVDSALPGSLIIGLTAAGRGDQVASFASGWTSLYNNDNGPGTSDSTATASMHAAYYRQEVGGRSIPGSATIATSSGWTQITFAVHGKRGAMDWAATQGCSTIGNVCADGTVYAGASAENGEPMFTTPADAPGTYTWNSGVSPSISTLNQTCYGDSGLGSGYTCLSGPANTAYFANLSDAESPYDAATYCENLEAFGHSDWYLPSQYELKTLYDNSGAIGGFAAADYWSSSQAHIDTDAQYLAMGTGAMWRSPKDYEMKVRCVRRDGRGACAGPAGAAGDIIYNNDDRVLQWCDGQAWQAAGPVSPANPAGGCNNPSGDAGNVIYNADYNSMQYCDGGLWRAVVKPREAISCSFDTDLVAHWTFDEGTGTTTTDTVNSIAGTLTNGPTWAPGDGVRSGALRFDGDDDVVNIPANAALATSDYTVAAWFKPDTENVAALFEHNRYTNNWYGLFPNPGFMHGRFANSGTTTMNGGTVYNGEWNHVAITHSGSIGTIYDNGVVAISGTVGTDAPTLGSGSTIGNNNSNEGFEGLIDEVRIYNRALTPFEISQLYGGCTQSCTSFDCGLAHHWRLDENPAVSPIEDSAGSMDGTAAGTLSSVSGKLGTGINFNAAGEYINVGVIPELQGTSQFTLAAWLKRNTTGDIVGIGQEDVDAEWNVLNMEFYNDGELYFQVSDGNGGDGAGSYGLDDTNWHHVVMVFDGTQTGSSNRLKGYVDGNPVSISPSGVPAVANLYGSSFFIGAAGNCEATGAGSCVGGNTRGSVDDVRIYNRPLSAAEVAELYAAAGGP
jgi:hypothetical protein